MVDVPLAPSSSGVSGMMVSGFDVSTRDGRAALLSGVRDSSLSAVEKAEARDLLFAYSHAGNEAIGSLLSVLIDKAAIQTTAPESVPVAPEVTTDAAVPAPVPPPPPPQAPPSLEDPLPPAPVVPDADPAPVAAPSEPAPTPPQAAPAEPATPAPAPTGDNSVHLERIKAIKHAVNEKVGNPVALIDANNQVGREYMDALLDAMKQVSGTNQGGAGAAMERLEQAFASVERMLDESGGVLPKKAEPEADPTPAEPAPDAPQAQAPEPAEPALAPSEAPEPGAIPSPAEIAASARLDAKEPAQEDLPLVAAPDIAPPSAPTPEPIAPPTSEPAVQLAPSETTPPPQVSEPKELPPTPSEMAATEPPAPAQKELPPTPSEVAAGASPAQAAASPVPAADAVPTPSEVAANPSLAATAPVAQTENAAPGDELHQPEITAGLNQLLSEWAIFKASGFLGTGPSGPDHPLYAVMKDLPMTAVVTGRFEGGTAEIKQSVSDYMKGWKYEQDVEYSQAETFEHYLRRVVKKILENARAKAAAGQSEPVAA